MTGDHVALDHVINTVGVYAHTGFEVGRAIVMCCPDRGVDQVVIIIATGHLSDRTPAAAVTVFRADQLDPLIAQITQMRDRITGSDS